MRNKRLCEDVRDPFRWQLSFNWLQLKSLLANRDDGLGSRIGI